ncbi:unnamed protein product, partial [Ectocarpus sp. 13 AM-2016]
PEISAKWWNPCCTYDIYTTPRSTQDYSSPLSICSNPCTSYFGFKAPVQKTMCFAATPHLRNTPSCYNAPLPEEASNIVLKIIVSIHWTQQVSPGREPAVSCVCAVGDQNRFVPNSSLD